MKCKKCGGEFEGPASPNNPDFGFDDECLQCRKPDLFIGVEGGQIRAERDVKKL